jgi:5-methylcytosine-specific restriction endonuclease McrA
MPSRPPIHRPPGWRPHPKRPEVQQRFYGTAEWKRLREAALRRDGFRCTWIDHGIRCLRPAVVVDHIVERTDGGADTLENLRSLCRDHDAIRHRDKGRTS